MKVRVPAAVGLLGLAITGVVGYFIIRESYANLSAAKDDLDSSKSRQTTSPEQTSAEAQSYQDDWDVCAAEAETTWQELSAIEQAIYVHENKVEAWTSTCMNERGW
jgi:hypothetical protein